MYWGQWDGMNILKNLKHFQQWAMKMFDMLFPTSSVLEHFCTTGAASQYWEESKTYLSFGFRYKQKSNLFIGTWGTSSEFCHLFLNRYLQSKYCAKSMILRKGVRPPCIGQIVPGWWTCHRRDPTGSNIQKTLRTCNTPPHSHPWTRF